MATNINGLIYYKLDANLHGYPGDITKNCGLRGEEIDGNFNFLHGNDIKSISFDENGTMYLTKYNGEILTAKQTEQPEYDFNYDPESGKLTIVTPDGKEVTLTGFKVTTNVYHDYTLDGYGSQEIPLEISNLAKTGRYRPAKKLLDTMNNEALPDIKTATLHDRYVTKEKISRFGRLFPLKGVQKIEARLRDINSDWRVPTKADWDELLNAIDCAKPEHDETISNKYLGEFAGASLKSQKYWKTFNNRVLSEDVYGFSIYPVGYCGNRGTDYYGSFGESSVFWTNTVEDNEYDMYVKGFDYDTEKVMQRTWGDNYYLSLRLVKTFTGNNFESAEDIDGFTSNCIHIKGTSTIWTQENIAFSQEQYDGFYPEIWASFENIDDGNKNYDIRYFINDFNGVGWDKHELKEGEGIVLCEGANGNMHEWLLVDGELVDSAVILKEEFQKEIDELHEKLDQEIANRIETDNQLWKAIAEEATNRETVDNEQWDAINSEIANRIETDNQLWEALAKEADARESVDTQIWEAITKEADARESVDNQLWEAITKEAEARESVDAQIWDKISVIDNNINDLQEQIDENKVIPEDNSVIIVPGHTNEDGVVMPTTLKVNLDKSCENLKLGDNGIYFDGYFGQF